VHPSALSPAALDFLAERHLASLTTLTAAGRLHVVAVGFTWRDGLARIITSGDSRKVRNVEASGQAAVCQVDGPRWLSMSGPARLRREPAAVTEAEDLYAQRYRPPRPNRRRIVLEIAVDDVLGSSVLRG
jgi:PPOX class probable F420-dependent enzyme